MPSSPVIDVLSGRPPRGVSGSVPVASACRRLRDDGIGALLVLRRGRLVGIISERDIAIRVVAGQLDPALTLVREVMTRDPQTIAAEASLAEAHRCMLAGGFLHLPVMRDEEVIGMISLRDIPAAPDDGPGHPPALG